MLRGELLLIDALLLLPPPHGGAAAVLVATRPSVCVACSRCAAQLFEPASGLLLLVYLAHGYHARQEPSKLVLALLDALLRLSLSLWLKVEDG